MHNMGRLDQGSIITYWYEMLYGAWIPLDRSLPSTPPPSRRRGKTRIRWNVINRVFGPTESRRPQSAVGRGLWICSATHRLRRQRRSFYQRFARVRRVLKRRAFGRGGRPRRRRLRPAHTYKGAQLEQRWSEGSEEHEGQAQWVRAQSRN